MPEHEIRSAAVVIPAPGVTDDGLTEWFVPALAEAGPGSGRRSLRVGDHLDPTHPLVLAWPERFTPSAEPIDCWPVSLPSDAARKRRQAEHLRHAAHPARKVTPVCARCGAESEQSVLVFDQPTQLGLINALSGLDDHDPDSRAEGWQIEQRFKVAARVHADQLRELATAEAAWRNQHQTCPAGTPALPAPAIPDADRLPVFMRSAHVRGVGEVRAPSIPTANGGKP